MSHQGVTDAIAALTTAMREHGCGTIPELLCHFQVTSGVALLAQLGCTGNPVALWERLTYDLARQLLPGDELTPLIAEWLPFPAAMQEFGARALAAGAHPANPTLSVEAKGRILTRLSRPAQVAFETYALAREVAVAVSAGLRDRSND